MVTAGRSLQPHREYLASHCFDSGTQFGRVDALVSGFEIADEGARRFKRFCQFSQPARAQGRGAFTWNSMH